MALDYIVYNGISLYGGYMPIITFSVPTDIHEKIKAYVIGDESENLAAKGLVLTALGIESSVSLPSDIDQRLKSMEDKISASLVAPVEAIAPDALEEIRDRLDVIDKLIGDLSSREWVQDNRDYIVKIMDEKGLLLIREHEEVLKLLGDRLNQLETGQPELHETMTNLVERLEKLEGWISSLRDDRALAKGSLGKFSDRLDALEKIRNLREAPQLPSSPAPQLRQIPTGLTHKEMSAICAIAPSVLGKLAKNRDLWPEGYMWSDESKKWFPLEMPTDSIKTAKGLNHQEMAEICGITLYAVTLLTPDRSKWPEGYMWNYESKKWFPMEV